MFGDLLEAREIPSAIPASRSWWVLVASEDFAGRPTSTSGIVCAPTGPDRDRPVVVWCHGTTGMGDTSVPSAQAAPTGELVTEMEPADLAVVDHGVPGITQLLAAGVVVVAPDYQGLGTPGFHHYGVNATGARDALASAAAAGSIDGCGAGSRVAAYGWSEGGGMALGVAELPASARGGLDLRAVATFAPGVPGLVLGVVGFAGGSLVETDGPDPHTLMLFAANGWMHDDLDPGDLLTPPAVALMEAEWNRRTCLELGALAAGVEAREGPLFRSDPQRTDRWMARLLETSAGRVAADVPIRIATGTADATVLPAWQHAYVEAATALGSDVTRQEYEGEDHCGVVFAARDDACAFLLEHLGH
ncbi:MAG: alpha/beta hydrolase family protein [Actinomycetota bacterium]